MCTRLRGRRSRLQNVEFVQEACQRDGLSSEIECHSLLALGLKHFEGTEFPKPLISKYLLTCKTAHQLTVRIKNLSMNRAPDNIIKVSAPCPLHWAPWLNAAIPIFFSVSMNSLLSNAAAAAAAKLLQSCPTLCDPIDGSPPGFPIPGILTAH